MYGISLIRKLQNSAIQATPLAPVGLFFLLASTPMVHAASPNSCTNSSLLLPIPQSAPISIGSSTPPSDFVLESSLTMGTGAVGIGTSSPSAQLHVKSGPSVTMPLEVIDNASNPLFSISISAITFGSANSTQAITLASTTTQINGSATVGTSITPTKTQLDGNLKVNNGASQILSPIQVGSGSPPMNSIQSSQTPTFALNTDRWSSQGSVFSVRTSSGTSRLNILANWNVGINQSNPQVELDINGGITYTGYIRFTPQFYAPVCDDLHAGAMALTSKYVLCTCFKSRWYTMTKSACTWS